MICQYCGHEEFVYFRNERFKRLSEGKSAFPKRHVCTIQRCINTQYLWWNKTEYNVTLKCTKPFPTISLKQLLIRSNLEKK
jgi:hypothetical protein